MNRLIKRIFLVTLLTSIGFSALLGIVAILSGLHFLGNALGLRMIGSALTIGVASLACFISSIPLEKRRFPLIAWSGIACSIMGAFICVSLIWAWEPIQEYIGSIFYPTETWRANDILAKGLLTSIYLALFVSASAALLSPRLRAVGFWIQLSTVMIIGLGFLLAQFLMWFLPHEEDLWKYWLVSLILGSAGILTTSILTRFFSIKTDEELTALTRTLHLTCPRCLTPQDMLLGEARCIRCKLKFKLEVEEPRCPKCNYILHGLTQPRCPECGENFSPAELSAPSTPPVS